MSKEAKVKICDIINCHFCRRDIEEDKFTCNGDGSCITRSTGCEAWTDPIPPGNKAILNYNFVRHKCKHNCQLTGECIICHVQIPEYMKVITTEAVYGYHAEYDIKGRILMKTNDEPSFYEKRGGTCQSIFCMTEKGKLDREEEINADKAKAKEKAVFVEYTDPITGIKLNLQEKEIETFKNIRNERLEQKRKAINAETTLMIDEWNKSYENKPCDACEVSLGESIKKNICSPECDSNEESEDETERLSIVTNCKNCSEKMTVILGENRNRYIICDECCDEYGTCMTCLKIKDQDELKRHNELCLQCYIKFINAYKIIFTSETIESKHYDLFLDKIKELY